MRNSPLQPSRTMDEFSRSSHDWPITDFCPNFDLSSHPLTALPDYEDSSSRLTASNNSESVFLGSQDALTLPLWNTDVSIGQRECTHDVAWSGLDMAPNTTNLSALANIEVGMSPTAGVSHAEQSSALSLPENNATPIAQSWICIVCHERFDTYGGLSSHARWSYHATLKCRMQPCDYVYFSQHDMYPRHLRDFHPDVYKCQQCAAFFLSQTLLEGHASTTGHASFMCGHGNYNKTFARLDTCQRHQRSHLEDAKRFPCKYCRKYCGSNGFKRKDHLTQHLRGYHHIGEEDARRVHFAYKTSCPYEGCDADVRLRADYVKHMRAVHNASEFPCTEAGCDRVAAKGYFRKADLRIHLKKVHEVTMREPEHLSGGES